MEAPITPPPMMITSGLQTGIATSRDDRTENGGFLSIKTFKFNRAALNKQ
jgi:hypothetical protein